MSLVVPTKKTRMLVEIFDPLKFMFQVCPLCDEPIANHEWFDVSLQGAIACSRKDKE